MQQAVTQWEIYTHTVQHPPTISGRVRILRGAYSPQLDVQRDVIVYLPPSYHDADMRYPVVYMLDKGASNYYHWICEVFPRLWARFDAPDLARENEPVVNRHRWTIPPGASQVVLLKYVENAP